MFCLSYMRSQILDWLDNRYLSSLLSRKSLSLSTLSFTYWHLIYTQCLRIFSALLYYQFVDFNFNFLILIFSLEFVLFKLYKYMSNVEAFLTSIQLRLILLSASKLLSNPSSLHSNLLLLVLVVKIRGESKSVP